MPTGPWVGRRLTGFTLRFLNHPWQGPVGTVELGATCRYDANMAASNPLLRLWFDTEFHDDGQRVELISLGVVCEDGREYYAENAGYDRSRANQWLRDHVLTHLVPGSERAPSEIADDLRALVGSAQPEFWADFGEYDWVVLRQLFGDLMAWPQGWPLSHMNLEQWRLDLGGPTLPSQTGGAHHALHDARWLRQAWEHLHELSEQRREPVKTLPNGGHQATHGSGFRATVGPVKAGQPSVR